MTVMSYASIIHLSMLLNVKKWFKAYNFYSKSGLHSQYRVETTEIRQHIESWFNGNVCFLQQYNNTIKTYVNKYKRVHNLSVTVKLPQTLQWIWCTEMKHNHQQTDTHTHNVRRYHFTRESGEKNQTFLVTSNDMVALVSLFFISFLCSFHICKCQAVNVHRKYWLEVYVNVIYQKLHIWNTRAGVWSRVSERTRPSHFVCDSFLH